MKSFSQLIIHVELNLLHMGYSAYHIYQAIHVFCAMIDQPYYILYEAEYFIANI